MQLVERYLTEVSQFLPKDTRDDILEELRSTIEEQVMDLAETDGREATLQDQKSVLLEFGHPIKVSSAFQKQQYLIGPDLFPAYLRTLNIILILVFLSQFVVAFLLGISDLSSISLFGVFLHVVKTGFFAAAIVTASFVFLEYSGEKLNWYESWRPDSLHKSPVKVINRSDVMTNLITEGVFLMWWNDLLVFQNWLPGLGEAFPVSLGTPWQLIFWPANIVIGAFFILHAYVLIRGLWERPALILEVLLGITTAGMLIYLLISQSALINFDISRLGQVEPVAFTKSLLLSVKMVLIVVLGFVVWDVIVAARLLLPGKNDNNALA